MKNFKKIGYDWLILLIPALVFFIIKYKLPVIESYKLSFKEPYEVYNKFILMYFGTIVFYLIIFFKSNTIEHKGYKVLINIVVLFGTIFSILFLAIGAGIKFDILRVLWFASGLFIIIFGNYYPVIRFKSILGINNKWTKSNLNLWLLVHKIVGKIWFFTGLIILIISLLIDLSNTEFIYSIVVFCLLFIPHIISFFLYNKIIKN